jgi:hypothetical protein
MSEGMDGRGHRFTEQDDGEQAKIGTLDFCYNANKSLVVKYPDGTAFE